jgi:enamine deaminase RidA (YjgF/YER057c/UK114 family)
MARFWNEPGVRWPPTFTVHPTREARLLESSFYVRHLLLILLVSLAAASAFAQSNKKVDPEAGYTPVVAPTDKNDKKKKAEETQVLALPPELPNAVVAETDRLAFHVSTLSAKGLLSQQTREALKNLMHASHGTIVKLRAFVAGSGDLRRVGDITAEMFQDKHLPLPALTVVQVGALPLQGAQVVIEATEIDRKVVNPNGVAFLTAEPASSVAESLMKLNDQLHQLGIGSKDALAVTCFVSSLDEQRDAGQAMSAMFHGAALDFVEMQRAPVTPPTICEGVARASKSGAAEVVITGAQLAFGNQDKDLTLAFDRLAKTLAEKGASLDHAVVSHLYVTDGGFAPRVLALDHVAGTRSVIPVEGLPSLDSAFGTDVIAEKRQ